MPMQYEVDLEVALEPVWHRDPPMVRVRSHGMEYHEHLRTTTCFNFQYAASGCQTLSIHLLNKTDDDTIPDQGLDKAVIIRAITFFGISDQRFIWRGRYRPCYPEPWAGQQRALGRPPDPVLTNTDRLSWNGEWTLEFDLPVFTWMHQVQDLGWIYR